MLLHSCTPSCCKPLAVVTIPYRKNNNTSTLYSITNNKTHQKKFSPSPWTLKPLDSNYDEIQLKENKGNIQHELKINMVKWRAATHIHMQPNSPYRSNQYPITEIGEISS
jgi:hypothetical protein